MGPDTGEPNDGRSLRQELEHRFRHVTIDDWAATVHSIYSDIKADPSILRWRDFRDLAMKIGYPPDPGEVIGVKLDFKRSRVEFQVRPPLPPGPHPHLVETPPYPVRGDLARIRTSKTPAVVAAVESVERKVVEPVERKYSSPIQDDITAKLNIHFPGWQATRLKDLTIKEIAAKAGITQLDSLRVVLRRKRRKGGT